MLGAAEYCFSAIAQLTLHSEEKIIGILKEHEVAAPVADLCRRHGMSQPTFYNWKAKFLRPAYDARSGFTEISLSMACTLRLPERRLKSQSSFRHCPSLSP